MSYLFNEFDEKERIPHLEKEITRLQELCRNNFSLIAKLKKENEQLKDVQLELKDTTTDLAYSLAELPWWSNLDTISTHNAFNVFLKYTKNIQYILQLPIFFDPLEQLEAYGINHKQAIRYLKSKYNKDSNTKIFNCRICRKGFCSEEKLRKHSLLHKNKTKRINCSKCSSKGAINYLQFKRHVKECLSSDRKETMSDISATTVLNTIEVEKENGDSNQNIQTVTID